MTAATVSAEWLADRLDDPGVRIVDTRWYLTEPGRGRSEYLDEHIPGAVFMDLEDDLSAPEGPGRHPLPSRGAFAAALSARGVGSHHHVVVYDDGPAAIAARLWWMLRWAGHGRVSVLDGGFAGWQAHGHRSASGEERHPAESFVVGRSLTRTIDREALLSRLGEVTVLDARAAERYRGDVEPVDSAAGHIPTALSSPTSESVGDTGRFKPPDVLAHQFADLGIDGDTEVVSSCGSGVTACHTILAFHLAGLPEPTLYPGSWSDWSAAGLPVATGATPGAVPAG